MPQLLLIEDNVELRGVLQEAVELDGYEVECARDAEEAFALLHDRYEPDVILCDVVLPHMSGLNFLRTIRANAKWAGIFFIAMSGTNQSEKEALEAGANFYLVKPFSFHELYDILAQYKP